MGEQSRRDPSKNSRKLIWGLMLLFAGSVTGCQVSVGGQTLPSPWYFKDDVQYYPPGSKLTVMREAAAQAEYAAEARR